MNVRKIVLVMFAESVAPVLIPLEVIDATVQLVTHLVMEHVLVSCLLFLKFDEYFLCGLQISMNVKIDLLLAAFLLRAFWERLAIIP